MNSSAPASARSCASDPSAMAAAPISALGVRDRAAHALPTDAALGGARVAPVGAEAAAASSSSSPSSSRRSASERSIAAISGPSGPSAGWPRRVRRHRDSAVEGPVAGKGSRRARLGIVAYRLHARGRQDPGGGASRHPGGGTVALLDELAAGKKSVGQAARDVLLLPRAVASARQR